jgi:hypothetical protein
MTVERPSPNQWVLVLLDVVVVAVAYTLALALRFEGNVSPEYALRFTSALPLIVSLYLTIGFVTHAYRPTPLARVAWSLFLAGLLVSAAVLLWPGATRPMPVSVAGLGALGSILGAACVRALAWRPASP